VRLIPRDRYLVGLRPIFPLRRVCLKTPAALFLTYQPAPYISSMAPATDRTDLKLELYV